MKRAPSAGRTWLASQVRSMRRALAPMLATGLAGTGLAVAQAWCAAACLARLLAGGPPPAWALAGFVAAALLRAASLWRADRLAFAAGATARRRLRSDVIARLVAAGPLRTGAHSGEQAALVIDRIEGLDGYFGRYLPAAWLALAAPALVGLAALLADPASAAILLAAGLLVPAGMAAAGIGAAAASRRQFAALARLQARFLDRVRGIATIVAYGRVGDEAAALAVAADELRRRTLRVLRVAFLSSVVLDCAAAVALIALALRDVALARAGLLAHPAPALFVLLLAPEFFAPLRAYSAAYQDGIAARGASDQMAGLPALPDPAPLLPVRTVEARGVTVLFDAVSLTWDPARGPALSGVSFKVTPGEVLVLAGPSGSGKSTVLEILLGFVRPQAGRVLVNGADIASLVPAALARLTAWVGQAPMLFAGTIEENVRFARPEATADEVAAALRSARLDTLVASLPEGAATRVGEGGYGLSGGQAQRIAIARAFLKNAPLLLLDEPTSHLDPATEAEVLDSLRRLTLGRTVILASHSTAAHAFAGRRLDLLAGRVVPTRGAA